MTRHKRYGPRYYSHPRAPCTAGSRNYRQCEVRPGTMQSKIYCCFTIQTFRIWDNIPERALASRIVSWLLLYASPPLKPWGLTDKICSNTNTAGAERITHRLRL